VLGTVLLFASTANAASVSLPVVQQTKQLLHASLLSLSQRSGPNDQQYFADGLWHSGDEGCWPCQVGPGTAAAVLWRAEGGGDRELRRLAVSTFDRAIADHRNPNGSLGDPADSPDITTMMFGVELGSAYLELAPSLDSSRRSRWRQTLVGAADFLIANRNLTWYTNGNVNIGNAELFYLAWRAGGKRRHLDAYNAAWTFALNPRSRWSGFGLHVAAQTATPGQWWVGSAGYLAESGGGAPGFDPEYSQLQLDVVSRLYVLSRDPRALRLSNLLVNALLPRVNDAWDLDTSGGTRHPQPDRHVPLITPAFAALGWVGGRADLAARLPSQFARVDREYRAALTYSHRNMYRGLGNQVSVIVQAAAQSQAGLAARTHTARGSGPLPSSSRKPLRAPARQHRSSRGATHR
jgi:hypothetical protein